MRNPPMTLHFAQRFVRMRGVPGGKHWAIGAGYKPRHKLKNTLFFEVINWEKNQSR